MPSKRNRMDTVFHSTIQYFFIITLGHNKKNLLKIYFSFFSLTKAVYKSNILPVLAISKSGERN